jgi:hypothetical protein
MISGHDLYKLQVAQLRHDEQYHKDVVILPLAERIKHMALHNAKYSGYFIEAHDDSDSERMARVLTDAFIITLATANTLNQDLEFQNESYVVRSSASDKNSLDFIKSYVKAAGTLAKYCEAWDHLENYSFRDAMQRSNLELVKLIVDEAALRGLDLIALYHERLLAVEKRSIFDRTFKAER